MGRNVGAEESRAEMVLGRGVPEPVRPVGSALILSSLVFQGPVWWVFIAPAYRKVRYRGSTFRSSVHNLCQGVYSVAVIGPKVKY